MVISVTVLETKKHYSDISNTFTWNFYLNKLDTVLFPVYLTNMDSIIQERSELIV